MLLRDDQLIDIQVDNTTAEKTAKRPRGSSKKMNLVDRYYGQFHHYVNVIYRLSYLESALMVADMTTPTKTMNQ